MIYRQLEEAQAINSFADFLKCRIGDKNVWQWPGCWADTANLNGYGSGWLQFSNALQEDVVEKIRIFAEGCDLLQAGD